MSGTARIAIAILAAAMMAAAAIALLAEDVGGAVVFAMIGALTAASILFEPRYRKSQAAGQWQATNERFVDPETGEPVIVEIDSQTGARRYVQKS